MIAVDRDPSTAAGRAFILGTAGHIDHGKSSLVLALTGTHPDRLPEEQRRGMTIELGFARLDLPGANDAEGPIRVGIVDVPGHERFVRTMVAGATGVDLGLLVVAADDGVMPQTREHVDILDLLDVRHGVVALSKADLVPDEHRSSRIAEVRRQIEALTEGTPLAAWRVFPVSVKTGLGLPALRDGIRELALNAPGRPDRSVFRLAIDRVFAVAGRGTVVTGSVLSGRADVGTSLELQPPGLPCKVREIQSFSAKAPAAIAGQRAALNLTGIDREHIERGMELATPGFLTPSRYVDARVRVLGRRARPVAAHCIVRVCMGTAEHLARLVAAQRRDLPPAVMATAQLRFERPVVAAFGQRFILREETARETLGGGEVIRPVSRRISGRHAEEMDDLRDSASEDAAVRFRAAVRRAGFAGPTPLRLACEAGVAPEEVPALLRRLQEEDLLVPFGGGRMVHRAALEAAERRATEALRRHHAARPAEAGLLRDRFATWIEKRTVPGGGKLLLDRLAARGVVSAAGPYVALAEFRPSLSAEDAALLDRMLAELTAAGFDPPALANVRAMAGVSKQRAANLEGRMVSDPRFVAVGPNHYITAEYLEKFKAAVRKLGAGGAKFKLAQVRDALALNRRVVQLLLEYLDRVRFTQRVGDERVLLEGSP